MKKMQHVKKNSDAHFCFYLIANNTQSMFKRADRVITTFSCDFNGLCQFSSISQKNREIDFTIFFKNDYLDNKLTFSRIGGCTSISIGFVMRKHLSTLKIRYTFCTGVKLLYENFYCT